MERRLTVRGMMVLVAIAGVSSAAFRVHPALGCPVLSVLGLAALRTPTATDRLRGKGYAIRPWTVIRVFLNSLLVASTILAISLIPIILILPFYNRPAHYHYTFRFGWPQVVGIGVSALLAIPIITRMKRRLW